MSNNEKKYRKPTSVRFDDADKELLQILRTHFRKQFPKLSYADIIRAALKDLAQKEGIS